MFEARLVVSSASSTPDEMTARLGLTPTETIVKGDQPFPGSRGYYVHHNWTLLLDLTTGNDVSDWGEQRLRAERLLCQRLVELGSEVAGRFHSLADEGSEVDLVLFEEIEADVWQSGPGYYLAPQAVAWLAEAGASISVSLILPDAAGE